MKLLANQIKKALGTGIIIDPFNHQNLGPNSYDLTLDTVWMLIPTAEVIDPADSTTWSLRELEYDDRGALTLLPGFLYIARTREYTECSIAVPGVEGRSSYARLGLTVHQSAGFGDIGFCGHWALELSVIVPLKLYAGTRIAQLYFDTVDLRGIDSYYSGKYARGRFAHGVDALGSRAHLDREFAP